MEKVLSMTYASSLTNLCEINPSFDTGVLRVAYTGENRNNSYISKDAFERSIKTMFNCPIVCNYDRDSDTLGGHDVEVVRDGATGELRLINATTPVGCIPESAKYWWENVEEEDGTVHEYLYVEALLWKRQEAYRKIKRDGITAHSMEITVKDGEMIDDVYHIYDFDFTAFALIGVTPCFESSALEMFAASDFKQQFSEMMRDLKESFSMVNTSHEDCNTTTINTTEGGEKVLQAKTELAVKYGIDVESLDFSLDDYTEEELIEKFEAMQNAEVDDHGAEPAGDQEDDNQFSLTSNIVEEIARVFNSVTVEREWGTGLRYYYVDCDLDAHEAYCWDTNDWLLYGFTYEMNGDNVVVDFDSKKRMKYAIVEFDEGEQASPFAPVFEELEKKLADCSELESKYQAATESIEAMESELTELRQFKSDKEKADAEAEREEVFSQFEDLIGLDEFTQLQENCDGMSVDDLMEKCYAIRGKNGTTAKFSAANKSPKVKVEKVNSMDDEPYGGLFFKYGIEPID